MKRLFCLILVGAFLLSGCNTGVPDGQSEAIQDENETVSYREPVEKYEYIGNRLETSPEPIAFDRGYISYLKDDLDGDGTEETVVLAAEGDGETIEFAIEVYERGNSDEPADAIHKEMTYEKYPSMNYEGMREQYRVYITDHKIQLEGNDSDIGFSVVEFKYDGARIYADNVVYMWYGSWNNANTKVLGSIRYMGYIEGSYEYIPSMTTGYCVSLIDGTNLSVYKEKEYTILYPEIWDKYIMPTAFEEDERSLGGTTFCSKTITYDYDQNGEPMPLGLFSVFLSSYSDDVPFIGYGGSSIIWHDKDTALIFSCGGNWMTALLYVTMEASDSYDTEELLRHHCIINEAYHILPLICYHNDFRETDDEQRNENNGFSREKEFSGNNWQDVYLSILHSDSNYLNPEYDRKFALIYVNDDEIPELVISSGNNIEGYTIYTFYNYKAEKLQMRQPHFNYIEKENSVNEYGEYMGAYWNRTYSLINGKWEIIDDGAYCDFFNPEKGFNDGFGYFSWNGNSVTEEEYQEALESTYDANNAIEPEYHTGLEMEQILINRR